MDLLAALPDEFVGSKARLLRLVDFLCSEMAASFEGRGLTLPPWRRAQALASKWLPARSRDDAVSGGGAGAPGGAGRSPSPLAPPAPPGSAAGSSGGGPGSAGLAGESPFDRLEEWQLRASARARRGGGYRGLLSDKLLGGSPPPRRGAGARGPAVAAPAAEAAPAAAGGGAWPPGSSPPAAPRPAGGGAEVRSFGAAGTLSRHPPVCSGQPATWKVVRAAAPAVAAAPPNAARRPPL
jgi:hypothetical protein